MDKENLQEKLFECYKLKDNYSNLLENAQSQNDRDEAIQGINFLGGIAYALNAILEDREIFLG